MLLSVTHSITEKLSFAQLEDDTLRKPDHALWHKKASISELDKLDNKHVIVETFSKQM